MSNLGSADLDDALQLGEISVNQLPYHPNSRDIGFDVGFGCAAPGVPIMCSSVPIQGLLAGKYRSLDGFPVDRLRTGMFYHRESSKATHEEGGAEEAGQTSFDAPWMTMDEIGLSSKELAAGWVQAQSAVGGVMVGARNGGEGRGPTKLSDMRLDDSVLRTPRALSEPPKQELGRDIEMWGESGTR